MNYHIVKYIVQSIIFQINTNILFILIRYIMKYLSDMNFIILDFKKGFDF